MEHLRLEIGLELLPRIVERLHNLFSRVEGWQGVAGPLSEQVRARFASPDEAGQASDIRQVVFAGLADKDLCFCHGHLKELSPAEA